MGNFMENLTSTLEKVVSEAAKMANESSANGTDTENPVPESETRKSKAEIFAESHSPLTTAFHKKLENYTLHSWRTINCDSHLMFKDFSRRSECVAARDKAVKKAYDEASAYLSPTSSKSIVNEALEHYVQPLSDAFTCVFEQLSPIAEARGRKEAADRLQTLVRNAERNLREKFKDELSSSSGYYEMYDFDYFLGQTEIRTDSPTGDEGSFFGNLIATAAGTMEYSIVGLNEAVYEIDHDLNERIDTFWSAAHSEYEQYVRDIEYLLDMIGNGLDGLKEDESILNYLRRMRESVCVSKEAFSD